MPILARCEREATTVLIAHLAIFDERRLYLGEGCSSLFAYCTQVLHFSEHAAYNRIEAARAARKYPTVLEMLADGSVNLATVRLLAPELTRANHRELLEAARHKSKRQVEELVARLRPLPPVPSSVRKLPAIGRSPAPAALTDAGTDTAAQQPARGSEPGHSVPASGLGDASGFSSGSLEPGIALPCAVASHPAVPSRERPAVVAPRAPERYRVQCTGNAETYAKLRLAQDLLRHQIPGGDLGQIIDRALTVLLSEVVKQKFASTDRPGRDAVERRDEDDSAAPHSRHIPAAVKRAVWLRDSGRCAFMAPNGRRCTERGFLEFHHVVPHSVGGEATVDNIQLRCRAHNAYEAELHFGPHATPWSGPTLVVKETPATYCRSPSLPAAE